MDFGQSQRHITFLPFLYGALSSAFILSFLSSFISSHTHTYTLARFLARSHWLHVRFPPKSRQYEILKSNSLFLRRSGLPFFTVAMNMSPMDAAGRRFRRALMPTRGEWRGWVRVFKWKQSARQYMKMKFGQVQLSLQFQRVICSPLTETT